MQDRDDLLDIRGAAEFLRVSEISLRRWTNAGRLPCLRIGGRRERRFRRSDLLAFLDQNPVAPRPDAEARHRCALYTSDLDRVESAAAFLAAGRGGAQMRSLLVATKPVQRAVVKQLAKRRPVERDITSGRLILAEYHDSPAAQLEYWRTQFRAALREGVTQVRAVGDVSGGALGRLPFAEILEYEAGFERTVSRVFPLITLCQYDARRISGLDAAGLLRCHPASAP